MCKWSHFLSAHLLTNLNPVSLFSRGVHFCLESKKVFWKKGWKFPRRYCPVKVLRSTPATPRGRTRVGVPLMLIHFLTDLSVPFISPLTVLALHMNWKASETKFQYIKYEEKLAGCGEIRSVSIQLFLAELLHGTILTLVEVVIVSWNGHKNSGYNFEVMSWISLRHSGVNIGIPERESRSP